MKYRVSIIAICSFLLGGILFFMGFAPAYAQIFQYQSMAIGAWGGTDYYDTGGTGLKNIDLIAAAGANAVTLQIISTLTDKSASAFTSAFDNTTTYSDIKKAALYARSRGLKVILKPDIQISGGGVLQTVSYSPPNGYAFFASVEHDLMNNVKIAKEVGADMLIIGTEMGGKILSNHSDYGYDNCSAWHKIISNIRAAGPKLKLTYAATMTNTWNNLESNEATRVCFWDALDYIGFDAYPDMNNISQTASPADFYNRMFDNGNPISKGGDDGTADAIFSLSNFASQYGITNQSQVKYIEFVTNGIRKLTNKPNMQVIITEIGAPSTNDVFGYWGSADNTTLQYTAQANGWDGVMKALATKRSIIAGISIWSVEPFHDPSDTTNTQWQKDFDPKKPAYDVIKKWFNLPATGTPFEK